MIRLVRSSTLRRMRGGTARLHTDAAMATLQARVLREQRDRALEAIAAVNASWAAYHPHGRDAREQALRVQRDLNAAVSLRQVADNYDALQNIPTEHLETTP